MEPLRIAPTVTVSGPIKVDYVTAGSLPYIRAGTAHNDAVDHDWFTRSADHGLPHHRARNHQMILIPLSYVLNDSKFVLYAFVYV